MNYATLTIFAVLCILGVFLLSGISTNAPNAPSNISLPINATMLGANILTPVFLGAFFIILLAAALIAVMHLLGR